MKMVKRIVCALLLVSMLTSIFFAVSAAESDSKKEERTGITIDKVTTNGVTHPEGYYWSGKKPEALPITYEAWVYIPKSLYDEERNVILGNIPHSYAVGTDYWFSFEIKWKGEPKLMFGDGKRIVEVVLWESTRIPADQWTHIAIVHDVANNSVIAYMNGRYTQKKSFAVSDFKPSQKILENPLFLGADGFSGALRTFDGILGDVAVYTDMRTVAEIKRDYAKGPDVNDKNLLLYYQLSADKNGKDIEDLSKNGYDMKYYRMMLDEVEMEEIRQKDEKEYAYSIAFLPDIQFITDKYPKKLAPIFDYIIDNKTSKNIKYVVGLGDMTDRNTQTEWNRVKEQFARLDGVLPYSLVRGNHDGVNYLDNIFGQKTSAYYKHVEENGGFYNKASVANTYLLFEENNTKYMIVNLDFGAGTNVLDWADKVIAEHPNHRVMIVTHAYLNSTGDVINSDDWVTPVQVYPDEMWKNHFRKHANIDMIVCGHMPSDQILCTPVIGDNGNTVYQLLIDGQAADKDANFNGLGLVGLMYFTEDGRFAKIEYYSTAYNRYYYEGHTDIHLDLDAVASDSIDISGKVSLEGKELAAGDFTFLLISTNGEFDVTPGATPIKVKNAADGSFIFKDVTFYKAGTYHFVLSADSEGAKDVAIDENVYHVTVKVNKNSKGELTVSETLITKKGSTEAVDTVAFANVYNEPEVDITLIICIGACAAAVVAAVVAVVLISKKKRAKKA